MTKNISFIINIVLAVAIAVLYYLHFSSTPKAPKIEVAEADSTATPVMPVQEGEIPEEGIVFVNTDTLLKYYDFYNSAKKNLENRQKKAEATLGANYNALQGEVMEFQKKAQEGLLTQEEGARKEQELMAKQQQFLQSKETQMGALMAEEQKLSEQLNKKVSEFVKRFSKGKKYQYVLGYTGLSSNILFKSDSLDITYPVIQGLNQEYKKK